MEAPLNYGDIQVQMGSWDDQHTLRQSWGKLTLDIQSKYTADKTLGAKYRLEEPSAIDKVRQPT
jgi:hypothetical protein